MKRFFLLCVAAGAVLAAASCERSGQLETEIYSYEDATDHADFTLFAELPTARKGAGGAIRADLLGVLDRQIGYMLSYEGERQIPAFGGDWKDNDACVSYYREQGGALLEQLAAEQIREMQESVEDVTDFPGWEYDLTLAKVVDTLGYIVYLSEDYFYAGGAHGGVAGQGYLTYNKKTGKRVGHIIDPACTEQIQPLLERGLQEYFSVNGEELSAEEMRGWLFLEEGDPIPLPQWEPSPAEDGILFVYQQYEIAPYALGMPDFVIPFADVAPFLTPEAKALLKL